MKHLTTFRAIAAATVVFVAAFALTVAPGSARTFKNVYWLDVSGTSSMQPHRIFFQANAGPYVKKMDWKGWGSRKAVGRGTYGTTAPCNGEPCPKGPSRIVLRKPARCTPAFGNKEGKSIRVYTRGTLYYPDSDGSRKRANVDGIAGWGACEEAY